MSDPALGLLMLALLVLAMMLGFPVAFTMMALAVIFGFHAIGDAIFPLLVQRAYGVMSSDVLIAVPLFLFMGYLIERANVLDRLFHTIQLTFRNLPASLGIATLITCTLFATATGIVGAVVTLMGLLALPAMLRAGYDVRFSAGIVCAGGCLGILIPPSVMLILYAAMAGESVVRLYAAALLPGLMLAGLYIIYVMARAIIQPAIAPKANFENEHVSVAFVAWRLLSSFAPLFFLIMGVLGAILYGLATPHEAAGLGAMGALLLAILYRGIDWKGFKGSVFLTARASAMVGWLFVGSWLFASVFALLGGQKLIEEFIIGLDLTPLQFLLLSQLIIFLLGWPLEWTEIIVIFVPIFLPLLRVFEIDPILFGVIVALNIQTAFLSPPVAMACYYLKGVAPDHVKLVDIFWGCIPFLLLVIVSMVVFYMFPVMGTWLPGVLYGR